MHLTVRWPAPCRGHSIIFVCHVFSYLTRALHCTWEGMLADLLQRRRETHIACQNSTDSQLRSSETQLIGRGQMPQQEACTASLSSSAIRWNRLSKTRGVSPRICKQHCAIRYTMMDG